MKRGLAVIEPLVHDSRGAALEHFAGPREVQTAMPEREIVFRRIEADLRISVPPINVKAAAVPRLRSHGVALDPADLKIAFKHDRYVVPVAVSQKRQNAPLSSPNNRRGPRPFRHASHGPRSPLSRGSK